jgi:hypothetical protein
MSHANVRRRERTPATTPVYRRFRSETSELGELVDDELVNWWICDFLMAGRPQLRREFTRCHEMSGRCVVSLLINSLASASLALTDSPIHRL